MMTSQYMKTSTVGYSNYPDVAKDENNLALRDAATGWAERLGNKA